MNKTSVIIGAVVMCIAGIYSNDVKSGKFKPAKSEPRNIPNSWSPALMPEKLDTFTKAATRSSRTIFKKGSLPDRVEFPPNIGSNHPLLNGGIIRMMNNNYKNTLRRLG